MLNASVAANLMYEVVRQRGQGEGNAGNMLVDGYNIIHAWVIRKQQPNTAWKTPGMPCWKYASYRLFWLPDNSCFDAHMIPGGLEKKRNIGAWKWYTPGK